MAGYQPLYIAPQGPKVGLVQSRVDHILPDDAFPVLQNAYVWRERILRKKSYELLGRLQRDITGSPLIGSTSGGGTFSGNLFNILIASIPQLNPQIVPGSVSITVTTGTTFTDSAMDGTLSDGVTGTGTINYSTGLITIVTNPVIAGQNINLTTFQYYPNLPVMGIRIRENQNSTNDQTVFFDTTYAYKYNSSTTKFEEFLPGTTWTGTDYEFFWTTNYWVGDNNRKIFWSTNFSSTQDPIRYTNGQPATNWVNFTPVINSAGDKLWQALCILPFRGRLLAFNTREGQIVPGSAFSNRIRWGAIGTPFDVASPIVSTVSVDAWRDDIRGKGGFLDIPTSEDIISVGFVRDNLVIYCERSTWQLRYTGRSIAPFQIEKVNSELGAESTFSTIQFDTSLVGIGDKGIVECDSFKSERIDIKIPDYVFNLSDNNNATSRIQGVRDFENRLAFWTVVQDAQAIQYPNARLVYNYENDSWAIFTDSLTALGTFQLPSSRTWLNTHLPWVQCKFPWISAAQGSPAIVGGNQQGFIEYLDISNTNDPSLFIYDLTSSSPDPLVVTSPSHNMETGQIVKITGIPTGTPFASSLNDKIYEVIVGDNSNANPTNKFRLNSYDPISGQFSIPVITTDTGYVGLGLISIRDNFIIQSKKFNFIDQGQSIQMGYLDILMETSETENPGSISLNIYLDYNNDSASNQLPDNINNDEFFNQSIPTVNSSLNNKGGTKFWQRVFCPTRGNFLTLEYTFNNLQMASKDQELEVEIDSQVLWMRPSGRLTQI